MSSQEPSKPPRVSDEKREGTNKQGNDWIHHGPGKAAGGEFEYDNKNAEGRTESRFKQNEDGSTDFRVFDKEDKIVHEKHTPPEQNPRYHPDNNK
ncbi:unnamed protein product [Vitrella brassicaformis CCMP3155]|uniref:Uncharacterized protein n=1 Tax=Vitrella brassicaformis (strain CCMP3155) TaxID=1169540 RepID=A0A0G4EG80_VITBC|nr:unnamed protein product [Vitrella brassicaformis CCMP3155]|eukprot:CEL94485.1 unnamed protein product [Vitrella brassicaformis CCMP3155]